MAKKQPKDMDYETVRGIHQAKQTAEKIARRTDSSPGAKAAADQEIATHKKTLETGEFGK